ncbi:hypothetical protein [Lysinibacillus fusiformis]|uniref:HNH endonuclease n=1 Tax=Lysinibacillus fusiformis TaxID=28031 RepID=UPI00301A9275
MIEIKSHHIRNAKSIHVQKLQIEVLQKLKKYKEIFTFLKKHQANNSLTIDAVKMNLVNPVISISYSNIKYGTNIDKHLQCIKVEYRNNANEYLKILKKVEVDVERILKADRNTLLTLIREYDYSKYGVSEEYLKKLFEKIFNYHSFSSKDRKKYNAYTLTQNLGVNSCPYCNRLYTLTIICKKVGTKTEYVTRPELDHYLPKSKYPLFGLSFNNLIPSCSICNRIKNDATDHTRLHHHPYFDKTMLDFNLNGIKYDSGNNSFNKKDEWDIILDEKGCDYTKESIKTFKLSEIYREHNFIVEEMVAKAQEYNQTFINNIENLFSEEQDQLETDELLERIFGVLPSEQDHCNPMNKFKRGIYQSIRNAQNINVPIK